MLRRLAASTRSPALLARPQPHLAFQPAARLASSKTDTGSSQETSELEKARESSSGSSSPSTGGPMPDSLADRDARGSTGGGKPLKSTAEGAPSKPKVDNAKVQSKGKDLTEEQKAEVDAHNKEFSERYDRAAPASDDKVDKSFWSGGGTRKR